MHSIAICSRVLSSEALIGRAVHVEATRLDPDDCAVYALTDFRRENPICVTPERLIDDALGDMIRLGIHALMVTRPQAAGGQERVLGLITSYRVRRQRMYEHRLRKEIRGHDKVRVGEIMTPWDELALVNYASLQCLKVSEVLRMFQGSGLTHVLVVEPADEESVLARGIISRATVARRLTAGNGVAVC
jgi:CBS domain-containing protein